jgi:transposase
MALLRPKQAVEPAIRLRRYLRNEEAARYKPRPPRSTKLDPFKAYVGERLGSAAPEWIPASVLLRSCASAAIAAATRCSKSATVPSPVILLKQIKGIGPQIASVLYLEGLFRRFGNRRQLAAYAGLAPTSWRSGTVDQEQGISKSGNPRLRSTMIELA